MAGTRRTATAGPFQSHSQRALVKTEPPDDTQSSSLLSSGRVTSIEELKSEANFASDGDGKDDSGDYSDPDNHSDHEDTRNSTAEDTKYDSSDSEYAEKPESVEGQGRDLYESDFGQYNDPDDASDGKGKISGNGLRVLSGNNNSDEPQPFQSYWSESSQSRHEVADDDDMNDVISESDEANIYTAYAEPSSDAIDGKLDDLHSDSCGHDFKEDGEVKTKSETSETSSRSDSQAEDGQFEEEIRRSSSSELSEISTPDANPGLDMEDDEPQSSDARGEENSGGEDGYYIPTDETEWEGSSDDHSGDDGLSNHLMTSQSSFPRARKPKRVCPHCYKRVESSSHSIDDCPDLLRPCSMCSDESDKYTELELRLHHQHHHDVEVKIEGKSGWSLDEDRQLLIHGFFRRSDWKAAKNVLPGRTTKDCAAQYSLVKPSGYYVFDIKVNADAPPATFDDVYRGLFLCGHRVMKALALSWIEAFEGFLNWWPPSVRKITDMDSNATLNELANFLTHILRMVIDNHSATQEAKLTVPELEERTTKVVARQGNWRDPTSMAEDLALDSLFKLATFEMSSSKEASAAVETFRTTLSVQCGKHFNDRLTTCFSSVPTFKSYDTVGLDIPIPPFQATLYCWIYSEMPLQTNHMTESGVLEKAKERLDTLEAIRLHDDPKTRSTQYRRVSVKIRSREQFREFMRSKLRTLEKGQVWTIASFWVWALRPGVRHIELIEPYWWPKNIGFKKKLKWLDKDDLIALLVEIIMFVLDKTQIVSTVQLDIDMLAKSAFVLFLVGQEDSACFNPLETVFQAAKRVEDRRNETKRDDWAFKIEILECIGTIYDRGSEDLLQRECHDGEVRESAEFEGELSMLEQKRKIGADCDRIYHGILAFLGRAAARGIIRLHDKTKRIQYGVRPLPDQWPESIPFSKSWPKTTARLRGMLKHYITVCIDRGLVPELKQLKQCVTQREGIKASDKGRAEEIIRHAISLARTKRQDISKRPLVAKSPSITASNLSPRSPWLVPPENPDPDRTNRDVSEETGALYLPATEGISTSTTKFDSACRKRTSHHIINAPTAKRRRRHHGGFSSEHQCEDRDPLEKATTAVASCLEPIFVTSGVGDQKIIAMMSRMVAAENPSVKAKQMVEIWKTVAERLNVFRAG
ncbi:hypothetical protein EDB81DRAFT_806568 [Dactylonectria macrodidyma]|uniref:Uncharacterized protein n=1 Tax=Dactylonectria macrodidyma TaxID=307937 RepID=A0A9P9E916_9HYPO|nr:hypothetical protein EDB81DRAFT_806568 [Dactylonectria macrodidyma]